MSDQNVNAPMDSSDSLLRPAASLTSIPVRRRRKDGAITAASETPKRAPKAAAPAPLPAAKPRKETFGKAPQTQLTAESPVLDPVAETPLQAETQQAEPQQLPTAAQPDHRGTATPSAQSSAAGEDEPGATTQTAGNAQTAHTDTTQPPEGIIALWESLAGEHTIPSLIDLDTARVAAYWPNSLLLRATGNPRRPDVEVQRVFSSDRAHGSAPLHIDTMMIDWMMALAREVTHDGVPVHELDNVADDDPTVEYGVIALPFGSNPDTVDHVLCHLYRYDGPPAQEETQREPASPANGQKPGRKIMATIFGRRQTATN